MMKTEAQPAEVGQKKKSTESTMSPQTSFRTSSHVLSDHVAYIYMYVCIYIYIDIDK